MINVFHCSKLTAYVLTLPLWSIPFLSVVVVALQTFGVLKIWPPLLVYAWIECAFLGYHTWLVNSLQIKAPTAVRNQQEVLRLFSRSLSSGLGLDYKNIDDLPKLSPNDNAVQAFRETFSAWFFHHDFTKLGRDNVVQWLAWSLFDLDKDLLDEKQAETCENCVRMVEKRSVWQFQPGFTANVKCLRLSLDPVKIRGRPLILYVFVAAWNQMWTVILKNRGFKPITSTDGTVEALYYQPAQWNAKSQVRPLLLLHGLGLGFAQYRSLLLKLRALAETDDRPLLVPFQPSISMSIFHPHHLKPPSKQTTARGIFDIVESLGWTDCGIDILSHSMGTVVHAWLLATRPEVVKRSCFVDPICFVLWEPHVPLSFLYNTPSDGIQILMRYFVARELGIALSLQRYFDWTANLLFLQDIPNAHDHTKTIFFLAGQDAVISATRIREYLMAEGVEENKGLHVDWPAAHGESLMVGGPMFEKILAWIKQN